MPELSFKLPTPNIESEFKYRLPGHKIDSRCYFRYYLANNSQATQIIILTELKDNPGSSITNAAEYIPEQLKDFIQKNYNIELAEDTIFIEHFQANHYEDEEDERFALFDAKGKFQHLSSDRLKLIFENDRRSENTSNDAADEHDTRNLDVIALLRSWSEEDLGKYDEDELDISYQLRGSPFVEPILDTWTIYQNLNDFPNKYVAVRRIGGYTADRKSELIIKEDIEDIRDIMEQERRIRRETVHNEEDTIVEIWI